MAACSTAPTFFNNSNFNLFCVFEYTYLYLYNAVLLPPFFQQFQFLFTFVIFSLLSVWIYLCLYLMQCCSHLFSTIPISFHICQFFLRYLNTLFVCILRYSVAVAYFPRRANNLNLQEMYILYSTVLTSSLFSNKISWNSLCFG